MKTNRASALVGLLPMFALLIAACVSNVTTTPAVQYVVVTATTLPVTSTPDPCAPENIEAETQKIHKYMREFDDASTLAASRPKEQLTDSIAELQRIRRAAEDQLTPVCLANLKTYQISHMNSVINTLIAFMSGASQADVDQGIALARDQHDKYTLELARVLGLTVVAPPVTAPSPTSTPSP